MFWFAPRRMYCRTFWLRTKTRLGAASGTPRLACPRANFVTPLTATGVAPGAMSKMGLPRCATGTRVSSMMNFAVPKSTSVFTVATAVPGPM